MSRVSFGSRPMPVCSYAAERPVPKSTRPLERWSSMATRSATRIGWWYGRTTTPRPSLIRFVNALRAPKNTSGQGGLENPVRKWCSTSQM